MRNLGASSQLACPGANLDAKIKLGSQVCLRPCLRHELRPNVAQTEGGQGGRAGWG